MSRLPGAIAVAAASLFGACGIDSAPEESASSSASAAETTHDMNAAPRPTQMTDGQGTTAEVAGPDEYFFIVDGPLVTNGPPWNCVTAGTECGAPEGNFSGTVQLLDDCIVVQGDDAPPGRMSIVIFEFGVTWDDASSTILGLRPEPVAIGDHADFLATSSGTPDAWTTELGIAPVPAKVRECMTLLDTDTVRYNTAWYQGAQASVLSTPTGSSPQQ